MLTSATAQCCVLVFGRVELKIKVYIKKNKKKHGPNGGNTGPSSATWAIGGNMGPSAATWAHRRQHGPIGGNMGPTVATRAHRRQHGPIGGNMGPSAATWAHRRQHGWAHWRQHEHIGGNMGPSAVTWAHRRQHWPMLVATCIPRSRLLVRQLDRSHGPRKLY